MSVVSYLETGTVLAGRRHSDRLRARIRFGRSMGHGGLLNFGDAFSYALARMRGAPPLFVGDNFGTTDVTTALGSTDAPRP